MNIKAVLTTICMLIMPLKVIAYVSDSSGVDGAFNPVVDTQLTLPSSGIFNFTDVNIPASVTITFTKNAANTGVMILASGSIVIDGTIDLNGADGEPAAGIGGRGPAGGIGGAGGYAGGRGGLASLTGKTLGERAYGYGAGAGGSNSTQGGGVTAHGGGSAGHATVANSNYGYYNRGGTYGSSFIRIPIGGSGGGGARGSSTNAAGGGGGGGAIILAATDTVTINGTITALGGTRGAKGSSTYEAGSGSGGAVRIIATTISGNGPIIAYGGLTADPARAGTGRIRLEADNYVRTATTNPANSAGLPQPILYTNVPLVKITSIAGVTVPANPTGYQDVTIPGTTTAPVTVTFETNNIPLGTTIQLIADGEHTRDKSATSTAITGSIALGTASANIELTEANVRLYGKVTYTLTLAGNPNAAAYAKYAKDEPVEKVRYSVNSNGLSEATLITASGKEYTWPTNALNIH